MEKTTIVFGDWLIIILSAIFLLLIITPPGEAYTETLRTTALILLFLVLVVWGFNWLWQRTGDYFSERWDKFTRKGYIKHSRGWKENIS